MTPLDDPTRLAIAFAHVLRRWGLRVPMGNVTVYVSCLALLGVDSRDAVYWAGRASLVHHPEDIDAYDAAFEQFWLGREPRRRSSMTVAQPQLDTAYTVGRYSRNEVLRHKSFAALSAEEFDDAARLIAALRLASPTRRSRRHERANSGHPDLRRTVHRALRTGGEPISIARKRPGHRARRLVLVCDVSGSMEPYSRAMLRFAHAAVIARERVEVFALGTRLTRLTRQLQVHDPDAALRAATTVVPDWSGGTRLGEGLRRFNDEWGMRGLARGATVVILSDGWDRGDPSEVSAEMARLHLVAHEIVWVNPLKATAGYEPLAAGMAAALPWVDEFVEGHSVAALESLARLLSPVRRTRAGV